MFRDFGKLAVFTRIYGLGRKSPLPGIGREAQTLEKKFTEL